MRSLSRRAAALAAALLLAPAEGEAQPSWLTGPVPGASVADLPDATSPPSLPDLTHRAVALSLDTSFASLKPHDSITGPQGRTPAVVGRVEAEVALRARSWYLGLAHESGYAFPPGGKDGRFLLGYPEIWTRAVWATRSGLAYGGGLNLVLPVFQRSPDSPSAVAAEAIRVVRPWDFADFADNTFTATPYLDARIIDGSVTFQLRQGLQLGGLVAQARLPKANVVSRTTLYLGYQPIDQLALGLEVSEVYFISTDFTAICSARNKTCDDSLRAVFAVSPTVRLLTRVFQPAFSVILPFDRTLFDEVQSYWAVRLTLNAIFDESGPEARPALGPR